MDELNLLTTAANGGIMLRSTNDEEDKKKFRLFRKHRHHHSHKHSKSQSDNGKE